MTTKGRRDPRSVALDKAIANMPESGYTGKPNRSALAHEITKIKGQKSLSPQAVKQWKVVPPERVLAVESLTGVSRYDLRPDIYGVDPSKK